MQIGDFKIINYVGAWRRNGVFMADRRYPSPSSPCDEVKNSVCIHTDKVYDSCKDKDCIEDARVFLTACGQELVDRAVNIKCKKAEVIWAFPDVEPIPFNKGYFSVDIKFFYKICAEVCPCSGKSQKVTGLAIYDKRVILFGSEGDVKIFNSRLSPCDTCASNMPQAYCI